MGNLISRPNCLGQKSKHVRSDEDFLKECYQRRKECQPSESTSTLDNAWHSSPSPAKTSRNGTLTRRTVPPEFARSPLAHPDKSAAERRASFQRRDSREGSPWSWKTVASREVTEVTEVTETIITEIVEVTEYPSGDKGGDPIVTRTVRVLNGVAEELAEVAESPSLNHTKSHLSSISFFPLLMQTLLTWVCEIEELTANQKPPSSEVKVVKAQLQEQKLLQRLLKDRRHCMDAMMSEGPCLVETHPGEEGEQAKVKFSMLKQKWEALQLEAEQRSVTFTGNATHSAGKTYCMMLILLTNGNSGHFVAVRRVSLELILPRAQLFQEGVNSLQQWLISVEQALAELRNAERVMLHLSEATDRAKVGNLPCIYMWE
uniref:Uncharacterized protein n=1 Tax=Monopterus albus TaxID=43700 RepID=A0A3Q3IUP5_MONAL